MKPRSTCIAVLNYTTRDVGEMGTHNYTRNLKNRDGVHRGQCDWLAGDQALSIRFSVRPVSSKLHYNSSTGGLDDVL